jgi:hypothetical protein
MYSVDWPADQYFSSLSGELSLPSHGSSTTNSRPSTLQRTMSHFSVQHSRYAIPRKPVSQYIVREPTPTTTLRRYSLTYEKLPKNTGFSPSGTPNIPIDTTAEKNNRQEEIEEQEEPRRGWRFYGTFGCLACLNLICAIDATILSVALPVWNFKV